MGRALVKVGPGLCEWSTVVDAPVSKIVTISEARAKWGAGRVDRAITNGHSFVDGQKPDHEFWKFNRAGKNEACARFKTLIAMYGSEAMKALSANGEKEGNK